jgi:hypothetical protein
MSQFRGLLIFISLFMVKAAFADVPDYTIHHNYESIRALGMGNAFGALADDYSAIFYNPAGLTRLQEGNLTMFISAMADANIIKFSSDVKSASASVSGSGGTTDITPIANLIDGNSGKHFSSRIPGAGLIYARPHWGFAIIPVDLSLELDVHKSAGPAASVIATQDSTVAYTYARDLYKGLDKFAMGVTVKGIYRAYYNKSFLALDIAQDPNLLRASDAQEGLAVDGDIGALYTFHDPGHGFWHALRPSLSFAVQNVGDANFTASNFHLLSKTNNTPPPNDQRRFNVGTLLELPDWWVFKSRLMLDENDIGHQNWTFLKGSHVGTEFRWKVRSWFQGAWRAGFNQGYWTAGFTGLFAIFQLDVATYGEEVGPSTNPYQSRRYMLRASLDF